MKEFFLPLTQPLGAMWAVLLLVALWYAFKKEWRITIFALVVSGTMFVVGSTKLSAHLLATLERPYAGLVLADVRPADAVVMLGGVLRRSQEEPFDFEVVDAFDRVLTSARLARAHKGKTLVLGGGGPRPGESGGPEGEFVRDWLDDWNVVRVPIVLLGACRDTRDEAERVKRLMDEHAWKDIILVTSASHMRRSEAVFRRLNIPVTCVACDFRGLSALASRRPFTPFPGLGGFEHLQNYLHEQIGWWVYRFRGWV